ncbi:hypothetical protein GGI12_005100 [Dipsacomyces acuminosporus]|nr:hypothetical protein GGI12_005100 [Dipsacomyces acuminosporus]
MSQESLDIVRGLVTLVSRTFYEDKFVLVLDFLNRHERAREDVLAKYLHVMPREVGKICGKLREDKLLRLEKRAEPREPGQQAFPKTYYHLDYKLFVDVVKWRMWKLQTLVKAKMEQELQKLGYECPSCNAHYSTMEALSLVDPATGTFLCENCSTELEDNKDSEYSQESQKELSRFMEQCQPIINLLKKTDTIILPPPTPFSERLFKFTDLEADKRAANGVDSAGAQDASKQLCQEVDGVPSTDDAASSQTSDLADGVANEMDCYDPYVEGIYALSPNKRRRLGLNDITLEDLADAVPDSIVVESLAKVPDIDIYVNGQPKPVAHITPEDEGKMTLQEYTEYWNIWHQAQQHQQAM